MTCPLPDKQLASLPVGAVAAFLALALLAPPEVQAGCSHLVTSRDDRHESLALTDSLMRDLAAPSDRIPPVPHPRPCAGAFCTGQPATPTVPVGLTDGRLGTWAWCPSGRTVGPARHDVLFVGTAAPRPVHRSGGVFHPPRLLPRFA